MTIFNKLTLDLEEWVSNQTFVPRNVIPVILTYPDKHSPEESVFGQALRTLIELHALEISPLPVGFKYQHELDSYSSNDAKDVCFKFNEKFGRAIQSLAEEWVRVTSLSGKGIDILFIEPDVTHSVVLCAWLMTDVTPFEFIGVSGRRIIENTPPPQHCKLTLQGNLVRNAEAMKLATDRFKDMVTTSASKKEFIDKIAEDVKQAANKAKETAVVPTYVAKYRTDNDYPNFIPSVITTYVTLLVPDINTADLLSLTNGAVGTHSADVIIAVELVNAVVDKHYANWHQVETPDYGGKSVCAYASFCNLSDPERPVMHFNYNSETGELYLWSPQQRDRGHPFFHEMTLRVTRGSSGALPAVAALTFK